MAAVILAGVYVVKKTKERRERRKSLKESRELRYAELQRETDARLAGHEDRSGQAAVAGGSGATVSPDTGDDRIATKRDSFEERWSSSESLRGGTERRRSDYGSVEGGGSRRQSVFGSGTGATEGRRPSLFGNKSRRSNMMGTYDR